MTKEVKSIVIHLVALAAIFVLVFGYIKFLTDASDAQSHISGQFIGKCYSTHAGALGLASSVDGVTNKTIFLEFPSGVRAAYSLKDLTATDCPSTMRSSGQ